MTAVGCSTASDSEPNGPTGPVRTCVGCRGRAAATELLRIVVVPGTEHGHVAGIGSPHPRAAPDPRRRTPGRGAWVHPTTACVELAQRRRAFARALRVPGTLDTTAVSEYVALAASPTADHSAGDDEQ